MILFNRLESAASLGKSIVGPNGVAANSTAYGSAYYQNGLLQNYHAGNGVDFFTIGANNRSLSIEFWAMIPTGTPASICVFGSWTGTATGSPYGSVLPNIYIAMDRRASFNNELNLIVTPYNTSRSLGWLQGRSGTPDVVMTNDVWYHFSIVVNPDGATNADKVKCYMDGVNVLVSSPYYTSATASDWTNMTTLTEFGLAHYAGLNNAAYTGYRHIDNIKIYDFERKADELKDRFDERAGLFDQS